MDEAVVPIVRPVIVVMSAEVPVRVVIAPLIPRIVDDSAAPIVVPVSVVTLAEAYPSVVPVSVVMFADVIVALETV